MRSPRPLRLALPLSLAAVALAGCGMLYVDAEIPTVQVTLQGESFPGGGVSGQTTTDVTYDLGKDVSVVTENDVTVELHAQGMSIETATAGADLSGIQTAVVKAIPASGSGLPEITFVSYRRAAGTTGPLHRIEAKSTSGADLGPYLTAGVLTLRITAAGTLPSSAWTADIGGAFSLKVHFPYGKKL